MHDAAMMPLTLVMKANSNFLQLQEMLKAKDANIPEFRHAALEEEFCKHLSELCRIFKEFGDLNDVYDITQMINTLKLHNWKEIVPYEFYLTPLDNALKKVRMELVRMEKAGPLRCKYIIEQNKDLMDFTLTMVKKDLLAQWLVGDSLKQDQFLFFYESLKIAYDSAVKEKMLTTDKVVFESVLPKIVAFKSLMAMRNIQLKKAEEMAKVKAKKAKNDAAIKANPKLASPIKKAAPKSKSPGKSKSPSKSPEKSKSPGKAKKGKKEEEPEEEVEEKNPFLMTEEELYI